MELKSKPKLAVYTTIILLVGMIFVPMMTNSMAARALVFSINVKANDDSGNSIQNAPVIAVGTPGFCIAWDDYRNGLDADIYFARSTDGGLTFNSNVRVDDESSGRAAYCPVVSLTPSGDACVAWQDYRAVTCYDIYFSRGEYPWNAEIVLDGREEM